MQQHYVMIVQQSHEQLNHLHCHSQAMQPVPNHPPPDSTTTHLLVRHLVGHLQAVDVSCGGKQGAVQRKHEEEGGRCGAAARHCIMQASTLAGSGAQVKLPGTPVRTLPRGSGPPRCRCQCIMNANEPSHCTNQAGVQGPQPRNRNSCRTQTKPPCCPRCHPMSKH